jgi:hypothetical protein
VKFAGDEGRGEREKHKFSFHESGAEQRKSLFAWNNFKQKFLSEFKAKCCRGKTEMFAMMLLCCDID